MTIPVTTYNLAADLGALLLRKNFSITTAESCTGGGIAYVLTAVPGSSAYLDRSFVTYSNKSKQQLLGVKAETLLQYGAVSKETVLEMAVGAAKAAGAEVAVAVSGIAGPDGGSVTKPVGTVHFCFEILGNQVLSHRIFDGDRATVRQQAIDFVLQQLILLLTD
ncbi:nicotinamide-nucleotide amidohydrolase family protein [Rheinheimera soli]|uniref:Nicotinamide-nucleotide amidase n=1 Tax=Rheinheimera soli TaxID=443616 RepID=A0ABU1VY50_9GAMM|nr:nicotinamide-nucleotide amidohydrolase family protein [Rheinheimera soli]MDR7120651.1 nicotinamide-nucleotide amidase [Rheinheimera soli]